MVIVYKSNGRGVIQRVDAKLLSGDETSIFTLPLAPFGDGGWYWFDLSGTEDLELVEANWLGDIEPPCRCPSWSSDGSDYNHE